MKAKVLNENKESIFYGDYVGRDLYITMFQDNEREFVVTHNANIRPVPYFTGRETEIQELRQKIEEGQKSILVCGKGGVGKHKYVENCLRNILLDILEMREKLFSILDILIIMGIWVVA